MVLGPVVYGMIVDNAGWNATVWFSVPVMILGFVAAWGLKVR
jgi:predicted MFS family arabinose efflux permease